MSVETIKAPNKDDVNKSRMVHITVVGNPFKAICDADLVGMRVLDGTPVDCMVCEWIKNGYEA